MISFKLTRHLKCFTTLVATICCCCMPAGATTPEPPGLFSTSVASKKLQLPPQAVAGKSQVVEINRGQLRSGRVFIKLPGDVSFEAKRTWREEFGNGRAAWVGQAGDDPDSVAVFGLSGDAVAGSLRYRGKLYKLEPRAGNKHLLSEVLTASPAPERDPVPVDDTGTNAAAGNAVGTSANGSGPVIDVLVAYTPAVASLYGAQGADALIIQAVAEANQAYANSKIATRLNLVKSVLTKYSESGDMGTDLGRLRGTSDGHMDELHSLRNSHAADVVSLIENEPKSCGKAYLMTSMSTSFAAHAFNVVHHGCATGYYSFAHEIGHNQGAHHDSANASGAIFSYAYGYQDPLNRIRTVMAYDCPGGCTRISAFSSGNNPINGISTGDAGYADNASTIDQTAPVVAAFRQPADQTPAAPTDLKATALGSTIIDVTWNDRSTNESGFIVDRSSDGQNYQQIMSLPAGTSRYIDTGLQDSSPYNYRVRAWNSSGHSSYSNMASAVTYGMSGYVDQLASAEHNSGGVFTGTFQSTWAQDGVRQSIKETNSGGARKNQFSYLEHRWQFVVQPGETITLHASVATSSSQSFTFAYSTVASTVSEDRAAWIDMFSFSSANPGTKQFTLPSSLSGPVYVSVRDENRTKGLVTSDTVTVDYLSIRTESGFTLPPGC